jgi:dUTP pyrophosphatase
MNDLTVEVRRLPNGAELELPSYATPGAAGMDLRAAEDVHLHPGRWEPVATGIAIALPTGYEAQVRPRSGLAAKYGVGLLNAPGTIDSDYRGEIKVILINHGEAPVEIKRGERIAQLVVAPVARVGWRESVDFAQTSRGTGGFGSTGKE